MAGRKADRRRLFAVPPDEFTAARDALARELRESGDKDEAEAVKKLRKPPLALWIANQLARLAALDVEALIEATARLRHGQSAAAHGKSGDELREAMKAQRDALARLADAAGRAALEAGTKPSLELQRRVQNTVQAAAVSEPEALREGVLESELQPAGFEGLLAAAPPAPAPVPAAPKPHKTAHHKDAQDERARKQEEAARKKALHAAEQEAHRLGAHASKLEAAAARNEEEAARARKQAEAAQKAADDAQQEAEAAQKEAGEARRTADEAAAHALKLRG